MKASILLLLSLLVALLTEGIYLRPFNQTKFQLQPISKTSDGGDACDTNKCHCDLHWSPSWTRVSFTWNPRTQLECNKSRCKEDLAFLLVMDERMIILVCAFFCLHTALIAMVVTCIKMRGTERLDQILESTATPTDLSETSLV